jgi:hypothetical protein
VRTIEELFGRKSSEETRQFPTVMGSCSHPECGETQEMTINQQAKLTTLAHVEAL